MESRLADRIREASIDAHRVVADLMRMIEMNGDPSEPSLPNWSELTEKFSTIYHHMNTLAQVQMQQQQHVFFMNGKADADDDVPFLLVSTSN
jgi:hypothetical protein